MLVSVRFSITNVPLLWILPPPAVIASSGPSLAKIEFDWSGATELTYDTSGRNSPINISNGLMRRVTLQKDARGGLSIDEQGNIIVGSEETVVAIQHFSKNDTDREEISPSIRDFFPGLFRGNVFITPGNDPTFLIIHEVAGFRDAEVGQLDVAFAG